MQNRTKNTFYTFAFLIVIFSSYGFVIAGGSLWQDSSEIEIKRSSVAFDVDFNQVPENCARFEKICIASRPEVVLLSKVVAWDVDENLVICSGGPYVQTTEDGVSFTTLCDTATDEPFQSHRMANDFITSIEVMPDGGWILALGESSEPNQQGNLFRSIDKGQTWTWIKQLERGFPVGSRWYAVAGNEVAIGEYGCRYQPNTPRRVYYSDDYGATWSKIYEPEPNEQHVHLVAFKPGDTNDLYVAYGDGEAAKVIKLRYTLGPGGKKDPNNWSETSNSPIYISNPACGFSDGRYLYWGHDGSFTEPVVWRLDPVDDSTSRALDWPQYVDSINHPYCEANPRGEVRSMYMRDGVYYVPVTGAGELGVGGIYVSTDGRHWVCAYRLDNAIGFYTIVGYAHGYLWGTYWGGDASNWLYKMEPVNAALVEALRVESGITNIFDNADESSFETSIGGWLLQMDVNTVSSGRTTEESLHGDSSLKVVCADNGYGLTRIQSNLWKNLGGNPQVGDYVCVSFWIKGGPNWPLEYTSYADISVVGGGSIDFSQSYGDDIMDEWQKITIWGKCVSDITGYIRLRIHFTDGGYTGDFSDATCYIDCVQVSYSPTLHQSGTWQIGGTDRADEYAEQSLEGLGGGFTSTFEWRPELSSRQWHGDIYIASWGDGSNSVDLYYDESASNFVVTDGNNTAVTTKAFTWEHVDSIKFAFTNTAGGFHLSVESPLSGSEHVSSGGTLLGSPTYVRFGTNGTVTGFSCGFVTSVRHWSRSLSTSEIEWVWDIYAPAGDLMDDWYIDEADFAVFSRYWHASGCAQSPGCGGADLDKDGTVGWSDLKILLDSWLSGL